MKKLRGFGVLGFFLSHHKKNYNNNSKTSKFLKTLGDFKKLMKNKPRS